MVLLGLHVCGGLTDAILALARHHRVAFLCCPCCFLKHPHLRHLAHTSQATPALMEASSHPPSPRGADSSHVLKGKKASGQEHVATSGQEHEGRAHRRGTQCEWCGKLHGGRCHRRPKTPPLTAAQAAELFQTPDLPQVPGAPCVGATGGGAPVAPWPAHEWEARWHRLARLGELTPYNAPSFAHSVAAHRTAMHSLGVLVCVRAPGRLRACARGVGRHDVTHVLAVLTHASSSPIPQSLNIHMATMTLYRSGAIKSL